MWKFIFLWIWFSYQEGRETEASSPVAPIASVSESHGAGLSQAPPLEIQHVNAFSDSKEEEQAPEEDLVSLGDIMDAAKRAVDAFQSSVMSRVSDPRARNRRHFDRLVQIQFESGRRMSPESSEIEYSSEPQTSITVDGPLVGEFCTCNCSGRTGPQEPVFIHLSSDSEEDIEID